MIGVLLLSLLLGRLDLLAHIHNDLQLLDNALKYGGFGGMGGGRSWSQN